MQKSTPLSERKHEEREVEKEELPPLFESGRLVVTHR
jgi:hypothetical protein